MASIDIPIYPERAASIRAGLDPDVRSLSVDLEAVTAEERDLLAAHGRNPVEVTTPTVASLFEALRRAAADERARVDKVRDAYLTVLRERRVKIRRRHITPGGVSYDVIEPDWPSWRNLAGRDWQMLMLAHRDVSVAITQSEEARAWVEELERANQAAHDHAWAQQRAADEAEERGRAQAVARLRAWALEHGSARVRLLIEEDFESWYQVAEAEFFEAHTPAGFAALTHGHTLSTLPAPTAEAIHALREAREIAAADDRLGEPWLAQLAANAGPGSLRTPVVCIRITGPHGAQRTVWCATVEVTSPDSRRRDAVDEEPPHPPGGEGGKVASGTEVADAIEDLRFLLTEYDDVRLDEVSPAYYVRAYDQLITSAQRLLDALTPNR